MMHRPRKRILRPSFRGEAKTGLGGAASHPRVEEAGRVDSMRQLVEIKPLTLSVTFLMFGSGSARARQIFRILLTAVRFEPNFENID